MGLRRACGAFLSPLRWSAERRTTTPVPSSKEGDYGAGKQILSNLRLARCKAADPWLWLAGLSVCRKREGVPLPRSGGGWEGADAPAAPYKHRLAHAPGRRSRSGRAFRCVGVLGFTPSRFWALLASQKCHPAGKPYKSYSFIRLSPPLGDNNLFHKYPPAGACKSFFPRRHMTSGAVIFSIPRVFSSTVAVARHRAARAAQTAESSHFTRQFW